MSPLSYIAEDMRNSAGSTEQPDLLRIGDLEIDRDKRQATRDGKPILLTPSEYSLLEYLAVHAGTVLSRAVITQHVWDESFQGLPSIVDVHLRHLQEKVDGGHREKLIRTIRGVGYCISDMEP